MQQKPFPVIGGKMALFQPQKKNNGFDPIPSVAAPLCLQSLLRFSSSCDYVSIFVSGNWSLGLVPIHVPPLGPPRLKRTSLIWRIDDGKLMSSLSFSEQSAEVSRHHWRSWPRACHRPCTLRLGRNGNGLRCMGTAWQSAWILTESSGCMGFQWISWDDTGV